MVKHCLIIGYGSIGARHARLLKKLGHNVFLVTRRNAEEFVCFPDIESALNHQQFDIVIISNRTSEHFGSVASLSQKGFSGTVLVEKPLFDKVLPLTALPFDLFVAYNFRFHPILKKIYDLIQGEKIYSMHVYCGQHLSSWRKGRDYSRCYSASRRMGGGVLRDLSHELDYINWMTGGWKRVAALGGKVSDLIIDSDDVFCLLMETKQCPAVSLQVNYFDRVAKRQIFINGENLSIRADLIRGSLSAGEETYSFDIDRDVTYVDQLRALTCEKFQGLASRDQGMEILELIQAAEEASQKRTWVENSRMA